MAIKIIPDNININFMGRKNGIFAFFFSLAFLAIVLVIFKGLNYGIDFKGGYILEVRFPETPNLGELRHKLVSSYEGDVSIQQFGTQGNDLIIKLEKSKSVQEKNEESLGDKKGEEKNQILLVPTESTKTSSDECTEIINKVKKILGEGVVYRKIETIGPTVGDELVRNAIKAIIFSVLAITIYIAFRFEWQFAVCGMIALLQDCFLLLGAYSLFKLEFNTTAIVAILTTASYSINDTIVIFDRIRENIKRYKKMPFPELINKSINETLSRTVLTAGTTLLAILALCLFGGEIIAKFSLPIFIGIGLGTLSSITLAAPLLSLLKIDREKMFNKSAKNAQV